MSTSLSRTDCKKHLLLFSASTPVGAIASYASYSLFGSDQVDGVGTSLLISVSSLQSISVLRLVNAFLGRKFSVCGNRAAAGLS